MMNYHVGSWMASGTEKAVRGQLRRSESSVDCI